MKPMDLQKKKENGVPHKLYDLSIPDIFERNKQALRFDTGTGAANYLGIPSRDLFKNRTEGKIVFSPIHQKYFAIRIATN